MNARMIRILPVLVLQTVLYKQGSIISPMLFKLYMDDLSLTLNSFGIGGYIGSSFIIHLCYTDDLCLISLSSIYSHLLYICKEYSSIHELLYIESKSLHYVSRKTLLKSVLHHFI